MPHPPRRRRRLARASVLSLATLLAFAGIASADGVGADGDALTTTVDGTVHLGDVGPAAEIGVDVRFVLTCAGLGHVDPGQSVVLTGSGGSQPADGAIVSVATVTLDPAPASWTPDGEGCPDPAPVREGGVLGRVVLRAPTAPADGYLYTITWDRSLEPAGNNDGGAFGRTPTTVSFTLDVVANTPPTLHTPGDLVVEGDALGGWAADWSSVTASDAEDAVDPVPSCDPAAGSVLPLGVTSVDCSATDTGRSHDQRDVRGHGRRHDAPDDRWAARRPAPDDRGSIRRRAGLRITDRHRHRGRRADDRLRAVERQSRAGGRDRPSSCSAHDATGNTSQASFDVTVDLDTGSTADATWLEPVGGGGTVVANRGRALPVKVRLSVDGVERRDGTARLAIAPCGGGPAAVVALTFGGGRWSATIDTGSIAAACSTVEASIDGVVAGAFRLELRGSEAARSRTSRP